MRPEFHRDRAVSYTHLDVYKRQVLYSAGEALERPVLGGCVPLGHMSFGDPLYLDAGGQVLQMDRRNGALFLSWPTLVDFRCV